METVIAAAVVAGIALIGSLYVTFKTRSGRIGTTEAEVLWAQQQKHISVITARLDHYETAHDECKSELAKQDKHHRIEMKAMRDEMSEMKRRIAANGG